MYQNIRCQDIVNRTENMERWRGKIAVVTGASAGIGAAIAEKLVSSGLQVVGLARRKDRIENLAKKLEGKDGTLHAIAADLTIEEDILQAFKWINENLGPISILINNAGIGRLNTIINGDTNEWRKVLDTNILGLTIATREAIRSMQTANIDGHVININSIVGHKVPPLPYQNVYPASKHAVTALTETLRFDLLAIGSKIKVSSVSPGLVETEIFEAAGLLKNEEILKLMKNASRLKSEDIADAVLYVLGTPPHVQISELTIKPVGEVV